jgi:periplasmic divalent cation tolerance protein
MAGHGRPDLSARIGGNMPQLFRFALKKFLIGMPDRICLEGMKPAAHCRIVLVTAPDLKTARVLARAALKAKLVACANLLPQIESHYWWRGRIERGAEVLLLLKTRTSCLGKLEELIVARHPYDTPEFIVIALSAGNRRYLDWLKSCCADHPAP